VRRAIGSAAAGLASVAAVAAPAGAAPPSVGAPQAILVQPDTGDVVFARDADAPRPVASATKLMTALVVLERARLGTMLAAAPYSAAPAESRIDLHAGERVSVRDLLVALLLESANDAAATLAAGVAGSRERFVGLMNRRARELGLTETRFANPIGFDHPDNRSSASDLAALTVRLRRHRFFRRTVALPAATLSTGARPRRLENRNDLVGEAPGVDGVKTGHTLGAGYVLVGSATRDGVSVVSVVLGASSESARDADSLALLGYGLSRYRRATLVSPDRVAATVAVRHRDDDRVALVPARRVVRVVRRGERPALSVAAPRELEGPLARGARAGTLAVRLRGRVVDRVALVTARPVPAVEPAERAARWLARPATLAGAVLLLAGVAALTAVVRRRRRAGAQAS
jgi:D-alanyl-D-alanine carboxypeptidase (penicillin-binding protein 5/6)